MKKLILIPTILLLIVAGKSYSQEQKEQVRPALLIIDIQNVYLPYIPEREKEVALFNINAYIELFRNHNCPVIRIYHYDKENGPKQETEQFEFPTSVQIKPDDPRIIKTYADGFNKTDLDKVIREKGCNTLFLCGLSAVGCVLATWIGAQNHDYKAFMIKDAIMSHNSDYTSNVEAMFDAVGYDVVNLILESTDK